MLLTVKQAAARLGLSQSSIYARVYAGQFAGIAYELPSSPRYVATSQTGRRRNLIRFDAEALDAWREQYRTRPSEAENNESATNVTSFQAMA